MDIPLDDPAANKAAAKIQAGFRGHMTRKKMKDDKPRDEVSSMVTTPEYIWKTNWKKNITLITQFISIIQYII